MQFMVESVDWSVYEIDVYKAMQEAVRKYRRLYASSEITEMVFQISIWTDGSAGVTAVNFETRRHAEDTIKEWEEIFRAEAWEQVVRDTESSEYEGNPASFKYKEFYKIIHPELALLRSGRGFDADRAKAIDRRIEESLLRVVDRIIESGILKELPSEEEIWIGISSPLDWYDHVRKIRTYYRNPQISFQSELFEEPPC